jgi:hypothetical protein
MLERWPRLREGRMIGEKMIREDGQEFYRIPERENDEDEGGPRGHVTE